MAKRQRIDTASAAVEVMKGALREIAPPGHVRMDDEDWPFWHSVIAEFARSEWTDHQLEIAGMIARTMANLEREQYLLREEGFIAVRENGTTVENPRSRVVKSLTGDLLSLRRSLSLHARARGGEAEKIGPRRAHMKAIEADNSLMDDLLSA
jgi:hypothetical protein